MKCICILMYRQSNSYNRRTEGSGQSDPRIRESKSKSKIIKIISRYSCGPPKDEELHVGPPCRSEEPSAARRKTVAFCVKSTCFLRRVSCFLVNTMTTSPSALEWSVNFFFVLKFDAEFSNVDKKKINFHPPGNTFSAYLTPNRLPGQTVCSPRTSLASCKLGKC